MVTAAPPPVEVVMPAPVQQAGQLTQRDADAALAIMQSVLRGTKFLSAKPSSVPGLVVLQMENGKVAYTDKSARYFIVGVVFDTVTGEGLDGQMQAITPYE